MATIWEPIPSGDEIMDRTARWVARLYGVKVTFTIDDGRGSVATTVIDRLAAPVGRAHACDVPGCLTCQNPPRGDDDA
jgi:hypothetical protein